MGIEVKINKAKKEVTITVPLQTAKASASGKTMVIATTKGNVATGAEFDGKPLTLGLNLYYPNR